ncbi:uncharacterized protein TRIADDRAFT_49936 [Trichoplax adhaerens]|uniref:ABC transporter domain-containing protein n=1 Tax=Trichoplax adhaerens TaxID=10228 RepID=B3RML6_TRIAD|nr:hypothetical protein TRIADDRAFT_49936 [Trichoplax adhaerens]EDV28384.1 hypothetical protein TRIADDRAFT_49936 [Trichoplax adhaerens]|eukprot:XP_002110218.1 hypothetical protein TRIADDRAFT_49936 [Trichoplax adhaerens]
MAKGRQFLLLLWKNFTLLRRSWLTVLFEVFLTVLFVIVLLLVRTDGDLKGKMVPVYEPRSFTIHSLPSELVLEHNGKYMAFCPNTSAAVVGVMKRAQRLLDGLQRVDGFANEEDMVNFLISKETQLGQSFSPYIGGVVFHVNGSQFDSQINYSIRLDYIPRHDAQDASLIGASQTWETKYTFPIFQIKGPRERHDTTGGSPGYYREGFLALQWAIDRAIIAHLYDLAEPPSVDLEMQRFPYPSYLDDKFIYIIQNVFPLLLMMSMVVTALSIVKSVVFEKERKLKESMKIMGLSNWLHWLSWFVQYFVFFLISMGIITFFLCTNITSNGRILDNTNPIVLYLFLMVYSCTSIMWCFLVSVFFYRSNIAAAAGGILWFLNYVPFFFITFYYSSYSINQKLGASLLSNVGMALGATVIGKLEGQGVGAQWSNFFHPVSVDDSLSLASIVGMLLLDAFIYGLLAFYIEAIFPGEFGVPQQWYFPFTRSYWFGVTPIEFDEERIRLLSNSPSISQYSHFEKEPTDLQPGISVRNIFKVFNRNKYCGKSSEEKVAVNDVSVNMYSGQITVLLGHNGAGKTSLMSMLCGMFPPTTGSALVNGHDICCDIDRVRNSLGLCPQHDILFDTLTVEEHLRFFAKLKGCPKDRINAEIDRIIEAVGLGDKKYTFSSSLSGGMKRKLSVGIALIGDSKVVLLDEPTSGMDPSARRFTWDLLQREKANRTILLTTHFMDEADLLGDRIAIMGKGKVICCGSSLFLKKKYGIGYHMTIVKSATCKVNEIIERVTKSIDGATLENNVGSELSFILPSSGSNKFELLFCELEEHQTELGISSFGASVTTMEEVFLKVNDIVEKYYSHQGEEERFSQDSNDCGREDYKLWYQQFCAMLTKRMLHSKRYKWSIISQLLVPIIFTMIALIVIKTIPYNGGSPPLSLVTDQFGKNYAPFAYDDNPNTLAYRLSEAYSNQFNDTSTYPVNIMRFNGTMNGNMTKFALEKSMQDIGAFNSRYMIGAEFHNVKSQSDRVAIKLWFNNQAFHSIGVTVNYLTNCILAYGFNTTNERYTITTTNYPLPPSGSETLTNIKKYALGFNIAFNLMFGMSFLASSFVIFLIKERSSKAKHVQFVSGVDPLCFWLSSFVWDLFNYMIPCLALLVVFAAFDTQAYVDDNRLGIVILILFLYGWAIIPLMYLFSFLFVNSATGFVVTTMFNIITGLVTLITVNIFSIPQLNQMATANGLKWGFLVLPNYCLGQSLSDMFVNYITITTCMKNELTKLGCKALKVKYQTNYLSWEDPGIGRFAVFMAIEGVVLLVILFLLEYGILGRIYDSLICSGKGQDESVDEEEDVDVNEATVNNLSIGISLGECFGLLGVNGAGKTTTFKMLTGDESITSGTAVMSGFNIKTQLRQARQQMGYCPQFDALIELMTGRELLSMFARLRGVPESRLRQVVEKIISQLSLKEYADRLCGTYSGGNKRKLCTGIALVGNPPVIFLDEPTTGMDPVARRFLWNVLSKIRAENRCIVITSHSMEECEALCTRLAIMVNGKFKCLGSPQHLKSKFGQGYTVIAKVGRDKPNSIHDQEQIMNRLQAYIEENFPNAVIKDQHHGLIHYYVSDARVSWAKVFSIMEEAKRTFNLEDYSVGQTTLEDVFLNFAGTQRQQMPPLDDAPIA